MNYNNTSNLPAVFTFEGKKVRSVKIDGEAWLVAKDVCEILEIVNHRDAVQDLDNDEKRVSEITTPSNGGYSNMTVINEPGLYKLTFRSRKPKAKEFTRWVTHDVLPEIRMTGCYVDPALKAARENAKPATIPQDTKVYLSKANFTAQERIIDRALDAKNDDELRKVLALDLAFKARTGFSAIEAAGISITPDCSFHPIHFTTCSIGGCQWHFKRSLDPCLRLPNETE